MAKDVLNGVSVDVEKKDAAEMAANESFLDKEAKIVLKEKLARYRNLMKKKEVFEVIFTRSDLSERCLIGYDGDVCLRLVFDENTTARTITNALRYRQHVVVTAVDEEKGEITCSRKEAVAILEVSLKDKIEEGILNEKPVTVDAVVTSIAGEGAVSRANIRLENTNLTGVVWCPDWSHGYTPDLNGVAWIGERIKVVVEKYDTTKKRVQYRCSRALAYPDPWVGIEKRYRKGDFINVRAVEAGEWFYGTVDGLEDITIRMKIRPGTSVRIVPQLVYQCRIAKVSEADHLFIVNPLRLAFVD